MREDIWELAISSASLNKAVRVWSGSEYDGLHRIVGAPDGGRPDNTVVFLKNIGILQDSRRHRRNANVIWEPEYAPIVPDTPRGGRMPLLRSFCLSVRLGGKKCFLVGCPESALRSASPKKGRRMPPRERVLQYGIGYSEGEPAEGEPLVIKYANNRQRGGAPFEKRFDRVTGIYPFPRLVAYIVPMNAFISFHVSYFISFPFF